MRTLIVLVVLFMLVVGAGLGAVGWVFSSRIVVPAPYQLLPEFEIAAIDGDVVELPEPPEDPPQFARTRAEGDYGLIWGGDAPLDAGAGYGRLGSVEATAGDVVARRLVSTVGAAPAAGEAARLDITLYRRDPLSDHGIPFETVDLESDVALGGWWIEGEGRTAVLLLHGRRRADLTETQRILPTLVDLGYPVLAVAHRNHRFSDPAPDGFYRYGAVEYRDALAGVDFLRAHGAERIVIYAFSYGSLLALEALQHWPDAAPEPVGLVFDSPMLDVREVVRRSAVGTGLPLPERLADLALFVGRLRTGVRWNDLDQRAFASQLPVPLLLFAGTADSTIPIDFVDEFVSLVPTPVTYRRLEGVEHVEGWNADRAGYEADVREFLTENAPTPSASVRP